MIPGHLRHAVLERAAERCEYCRLSQAGQEAAFHVDHVIPLAQKGPTDLENLALACVSCSLRKGARLLATDPATGETSTLFNPRRDSWTEHFRWDGVRAIGLSPTGRATIAALHFNRPLALAIRHEEQLRHRHPN